MDALVQFERLRDDEVQILGPGHRLTLDSRSHLADLLGRLGKVDEAIAQLEQVLEDEVRVLGQDHHFTQ